MRKVEGGLFSVSQRQKGNTSTWHINSEEQNWLGNAPKISNATLYGQFYTRSCLRGDQPSKSVMLHYTGSFTRDHVYVETSRVSQALKS
jgi:hypothetical protein